LAPSPVDEEGRVVEVVEGRTTGPWPIWWADAKGELRAEELTVLAASTDC